MTDLEKWAVFFRYADVPEHRETVIKVIESKEVLQMAGSLLLSVSQNEHERAKFRSRRMYQTDQESNIATAEARGEQKGRNEIARNMIIDEEPIDKIIRYTGLSHDEIESLRNDYLKFRV
jgi:predicted transposase/invertase (TIGR01784 family)